MDAFVKLSLEERRIFFEGAAAPLNLAPLMVEKNVWILSDPTNREQAPATRRSSAASKTEISQP